MLHQPAFHSPSLSVASLHSSFSPFTAAISQPHGSICRLFRQSLGVTCHPASSPLPSRRLLPSFLRWLLSAAEATATVKSAGHTTQRLSTRSFLHSQQKLPKSFPHHRSDEYFLPHTNAALINTCASFLSPGIHSAAVTLSLSKCAQQHHGSHLPAMPFALPHLASPGRLLSIPHSHAVRRLAIHYIPVFAILTAPSRISSHGVRHPLYGSPRYGSKFAPCLCFYLPTPSLRAFEFTS